MPLTMHKIKTKNFKFHDLTKQRIETKKKVRKSFNNMETMNQQLRLITNYEGTRRKR